ncbi:MAG: virulence RhuM family protein [Gracilibacteraceae bacterium]|jgi:hypothetical protein|nr:virulence RhuM family protein [Gracilibacteraceae bacterium]
MASYYAFPDSGTAHEKITDFAEFTALEQQPMAMADWIAALDNQIVALRREVLRGTGRVSHKQAIEKAAKEFAIYREREMKQLESDFDRAVKEFAKLNPPRKAT